MSSGKREDTGNLKRKHYIALGVELALQRDCEPVVRQNKKKWLINVYYFRETWYLCHHCKYILKMEAAG
jgi:hypothetical protein